MESAGPGPRPWPQALVHSGLVHVGVYLLDSDFGFGFFLFGLGLFWVSGARPWVALLGCSLARFGLLALAPFFVLGCRPRDQAQLAPWPLFVRIRGGVAIAGCHGPSRA